MENNKNTSDHITTRSRVTSSDHVSQSDRLTLGSRVISGDYGARGGHTTWTIGKVLAWSARYFGGLGIDTPRLDAEVLLAHILSESRIYLYINFDKPLDPDELASFREAVKRRARREPVAYITGRREFMGLSFAVTSAVLVPRPDTETLVTEALTRLLRSETRLLRPDEPPLEPNIRSATESFEMADTRQHREKALGVTDGCQSEPVRGEHQIHSKSREVTVHPSVGQPLYRHPLREKTRVVTTNPKESGSIVIHQLHSKTRVVTDGYRIADIGTGSGAIALSLIKNLPESTAVATDISADALAVAKKNADALGLLDRVTFRVGDLMEPLGGEKFDLIVSNPPYIRRADIDTLAPEVLKEPRVALDGGDDGLDFYRRIIYDAPSHLADGGLLAVECGAGQAEEIAAIAKDGGCFGETETIRDLSGIERVVIMRRGGSFLGSQENPSLGS